MFLTPTTGLSGLAAGPAALEPAIAACKLLVAACSALMVPDRGGAPFVDAAELDLDGSTVGVVSGTVVEPKTVCVAGRPGDNRSTLSVPLDSGGEGDRSAEVAMLFTLPGTATGAEADAAEKGRLRP